MSTAAPPRTPTPSSPPAASGKDSAAPFSGKTGKGKTDADGLIEQRIAEACRVLWWAEVVRTVLRLVIAAIAALLVWLVVDQWIYSSGVGLRVILFVSLLGAAAWYLKQRVLPLLGSSIRPEYAARSLERDLPELRQSLTSYVTLRDDRPAADLRSRVVRSMGSVTAGRLKAYNELPAEATGTIRWWVATACAMALLVAYAVVSPKNSLRSAARLAAPIASIDPARRVSISDVTPGDVEAIAGRMVAVACRIDGMRDAEEAICQWNLSSGRQEVVLQLDSDTDQHSGEMWLPHSASGTVTYTVSAGDAIAGPFRLRVQDVPVVALQSVHYQPPKYTQQSDHTSSSGAITALDGTRVRILVTTNRAVEKAKIEFNPRLLGDRTQATAGAVEMEIDSDGTTLSTSFVLRSARGRSSAVELEGYRIKVADASGQSNPDPIIYPIRIISDLPPEISITMPFRSPQDVPLDAQQIVEVHASDPDYGLSRIRLEIRSGLDLIAEPVLWSHATGQKGNQVTEYRFRPAEHDLQIGATVQIVAIATDNRASELNANIVPNVTRTDPVELKITAAAPLPDPDDPNANGLSTPDDRPANDHQEQSGESGGEQGQKQSGGGSGGDGESSQSASGDNQSGGESTSQSGENGEEGESGDQQGSDQQNGEGGSGDESEDRSGDGSQSSGSMEESSSGESSSGESSSGEGTEDQEDPSNEGSDASDSGDNSSDSGDNAGDSGENAGHSGGTQDSESTASSGQDQSAEGGNGSSSESNSARPEDANSGSSQSNEGGGSESQQESNGASAESSDSGANSPESGTGSQSSPEHDAEAFERIRDYLEKKQNERQQQGGGSDSKQGEQSDSGDEGGQSADSSAADSASQENGNGDSMKQNPEGAEQGSGEQGSGEQGAGEQGAGEQGAGETGANSDQNNSDQNNSDQNNSGQEGGGESQQDGDSRQQDESGADQNSAGSESEQGSKGSSETKQQDSQEGSSNSEDGQEAGSDASSDAGEPGEQGTGEQGTGEQSASEQGSGEQADDVSRDSGDEASREQGNDASREAGDESGNESSGDSESSPTDPRESKENSSSQPSSEPPKGNSKPDPSNAPSTSNAGTGSGDDKGESSESAVPPDPVNVEYAKKATDMVLDYLDETRDAPDRDLLDELNWSDDDLKRFADRWKNVREMGSGDSPSGENREIEDALKSLGLRPPSGTADNVRETGDSLRGLRDSGNRKPPPAAYRDAFDAFRRAMGRKR